MENETERSRRAIDEFFFFERVRHSENCPKNSAGVHMEFLGLFFGKDRRPSHDSDPGALAGEERLWSGGCRVHCNLLSFGLKSTRYRLDSDSTQRERARVSEHRFYH